MKQDVINFKNKFTKFTEHWSPRVIAEMNDYQFKLVKIKGEFTEKTDVRWIILVVPISKCLLTCDTLSHNCKPTASVD